MLLKEGTDIILIVLKKGRLTIGALKGILMQVPPIAMITDTEILDTLIIMMFHRDGQGLHALRGGNEATITVSLF